VNNESPISKKALFNNNLEIETKNEKINTYKEMRYNKIINRDNNNDNRICDLDNNNKYVYEKDYNDIENKLFKTEDNNYIISEVNEYSEEINDENIYNSNNNDDYNKIENTELYKVRNNSNNVDITLSDSSNYVQENENDNYIKNKEYIKIKENKNINPEINHYETISSSLNIIMKEFNHMPKEDIIKKLRKAIYECNQIEELHKNDSKRINELMSNISNKSEDYNELFNKYQELLKTKSKINTSKVKEEKSNSNSELELLLDKNNRASKVNETIDTNTLNDKNGSLENLEKKVKEQKKIIDDYEFIMEQNNKEKKIYISNLENDLNITNEKLNEYKLKFDAKNKENEDLLKIIEDIEKKRKESIEQYDVLDHELKMNQKKMKELQNENNTLDISLIEANKNISSLKNEIKDLVEKNDDITKELMEYQDNYEGLNSELNEYRKDNEILNNELQEYKKSNEYLNSKLHDSKELLDNAIQTEEKNLNSLEDNEVLFQRYREKSIPELLEKFKHDPPHKIEEIYCMTNIIISELERDLKSSKDKLHEEKNLRESISMKQIQNIQSINELEQSLSEIQSLHKEQMNINQQNENEIKRLLKKLSYSNTQIESIQNKLLDQQDKINQRTTLNEKTKDLEQKNKDSQIQIQKLNKIIEDNQNKNAFIERKFDEFFKMFNEKFTAYIKSIYENNSKETKGKNDNSNYLDIEDIKVIIKENSELKHKLEKLTNNTLIENYNRSIRDLINSQSDFIDTNIIHSIDDYDSMSKDDIIQQLTVLLEKYKDISEQFEKVQGSYSDLEKTYETLQNTYDKKEEKLVEYEQEKTKLADRIQHLEEEIIKERNYTADCEQLKNEIINKDKELEISHQYINEMKLTLETITTNSSGMQKELDEKNNLIDNYIQKINQLNSDILHITNEVEMKDRSNEDIRNSYENEKSKTMKDLVDLKNAHSNILKELDDLKKQYNELQEKYNNSIEENSNSLLSAEKQKSEIELKMNTQINENAILLAKNESLESVIKKQEQDIEEINIKNDQLSAKYNDERLANEKLNGEIKKLMMEIEYGENERKTIFNTKTQMDNDYSTLRSQYDVVNQKLKEYEEENKRISCDQSDMKIKNEELNKKYNDLEVQYKLVKNSLDEKSQENENIKNLLNQKSQENESLKYSLEDFILLGRNDDNGENEDSSLGISQIKSLNDFENATSCSKYLRSISKRIEKEREDLKEQINKMQITINDITTENNLIKQELADSQNHLLQLEEENGKIKKDSENMYNEEMEKREKEHQELNQSYSDSINEKEKEINRLKESCRNSQMDIEKLKKDIQRSESELKESQKRNKEMEISLNESLERINILMKEKSQNKDNEEDEMIVQKQMEEIERNKQETITYKNEIKELKQQIDTLLDEKDRLEQKLKFEIIPENEFNIIKMDENKHNECEEQIKNTNLENNELVKDIHIKYEALIKEHEELTNSYNEQCNQINLLWKSLSPVEEEVLDNNKDLLSLKEYIEKELTQKKNTLQEFKESTVKQIEEKCKENEKLKKDIDEIKEEYDEKVKKITEQLNKQTEELKKVEDLRDQQINEMKENYNQKIQTLQHKISNLKESLRMVKQNNKREKRELENLISNKNLKPYIPRNSRSLSHISSQSFQSPSSHALSQINLSPSNVNSHSSPLSEKDLDDNKENNSSIIYSNSIISESNHSSRSKYNNNSNNNNSNTNNNNNNNNNYNNSDTPVNGILLHNVNNKANNNVLRSCLSEINDNSLRELSLQKVYNSCCNLHLQPNSLNKSLSKEIHEMRQRLNLNSESDKIHTRKHLLEMDKYLLENDDLMETFKSTDLLKKKLLEFETKYT